jgi:hypothetical protein
MACGRKGDKMAKTGSRLVAVLLLLIAALALKGELTGAPPLAPAAPGGFDTKQALQRLGRVLGDQRPHPVDTEADDAARERLVAELRGIGLAPRVTEAWACNGAPKSRSIGCADVRNVVASLGPENGSHLLLAAHYDSTPTGPGAADDGIGVASMLEIASLLKTHPPRRPVDFLFDEGEEAGLLGATAFLEHDPLAPRVDSLINMEARGVTGPAIMFETSRPNGSALDAYRRAAAHPVANSMTTDFYQLIPNATDVSVLSVRPWTILNYAIIGNETRYHSAGDRLDALDPRSLRQMGSEALAATEQLASGAPKASRQEYVYADLLGRTLLVPPKIVALWLFGALILAFLWLGWRRRIGLGRGIGAVAAGLVTSALFVFAAQWVVGFIRPGIYWRAHPGIIAVAVDVAALAGCAAMLAWIGRPLARDRLRAAFWLVFLLLDLLIVLVAPGGVIFALLPPLPLLVGVSMERRFPGAETVGAVFFLAFALPVLGPAPRFARSAARFRRGAGLRPALRLAGAAGADRAQAARRRFPAPAGPGGARRGGARRLDRRRARAGLFRRPQAEFPHRIWLGPADAEGPMADRQRRRASSPRLSGRRPLPGRRRDSLVDGETQSHAGPGFAARAAARREDGRKRRSRRGAADPAAPRRRRRGPDPASRGTGCGPGRRRHRRLRRPLRPGRKEGPLFHPLCRAELRRRRDRPSRRPPGAAGADPDRRPFRSSPSRRAVRRGPASDGRAAI